VTEISINAYPHKSLH